MDVQVFCKKDELMDCITNNMKFRKSSFFKDYSDTEALLVLESRAFWLNRYMALTIHIKEKNELCNVTVFTAISSISAIDTASKEFGYKTLFSSLEESGITYEIMDGR